METLFILKQVILHQRKNTDEEVSGEINYPQPDNTTCVSSHIPAIYILYCLYLHIILSFVSYLNGLAENCSEIIWLHENDMRPPIFAAELLALF